MCLNCVNLYYNIATTVPLSALVRERIIVLLIARDMNVDTMNALDVLYMRQRHFLRRAPLHYWKCACTALPVQMSMEARFYFHCVVPHWNVLIII